MSGLATLIRLHRWRLDQKRRARADLERLMQDLTGQAVRLEGEVQAEQDRSPALECGVFAYGRFAQAVVIRREKLSRSIDEVKTRLDQSDAEIAEAFQSLKRYEIAAAARDMRERKEREAKAQAESDEIGLAMHRRAQPAR